MSPASPLNGGGHWGEPLRLLALWHPVKMPAWWASMVAGGHMENPVRPECSRLRKESQRLCLPRMMVMMVITLDCLPRGKLMPKSTPCWPQSRPGRGSDYSDGIRTAQRNVIERFPGHPARHTAGPGARSRRKPARRYPNPKSGKSCRSCTEALCSGFVELPALGTHSATREAWGVVADDLVDRITAKIRGEVLG